MEEFSFNRNEHTQQNSDAVSDDGDVPEPIWVRLGMGKREKLDRFLLRYYLPFLVGLGILLYLVLPGPQA